MTDTPRLIERAFPLKQVSLDSVHEKNVRHGHISTLHIWPARRPLAACRAALIATLLPDPGAEAKPAGMSEADWQAEVKRRREKLCQKIGGKIVKKIKKKRMPDGRVIEREEEETQGGILHWKRETENAEDLDWFCQEIRRAYGGRAPRVLDPFAGGGAIPLEAMRLGCEVTAADINPVAWFILKCTLEYPQRLAGKTHRLPDFIISDMGFMQEFFLKGKRYSPAEAHKALERLGKRQEKDGQVALDFEAEPELEADLAWQVRAWGQWVLDRVRRELARFYPTYADFEPLEVERPYERQPLQLVPLKENGTADVNALNAEFSPEYLADVRNPRWVKRPTVAYLWARAVSCKNCRATVPLLKTRWLCKKAKNRVLLTIEPRADRTGVVFGIERDVPVKGGNTAQRREQDRRLGEGTMSKAGVRCPCCPAIMTQEDLQIMGQQYGLGEVLYAVVIEGSQEKDFRLPAKEDHEAWSRAVAARWAAAELDTFGAIEHSIDPRRPSPKARGLSGLPRYGIDTFEGVFNERQQLSLFTFARAMRDVYEALVSCGYGEDWAIPIADFLALLIGKLADYNSKGCTWNVGRQGIGHTFTRFALPMTTDYAEANLILHSGGGFASALSFAGAIFDNLLKVTSVEVPPEVALRSAASARGVTMDLIITDPPYYDAIPYSDISDYFYIWLRRAAGTRHPTVFNTELVPRNEEILQHAGRLDGDNERAKLLYEERMAAAFEVCRGQLCDQGLFVVVFAHKEPDAWETLVQALIRSGFEVHASWPIQTERDTRFTTLGGAALASSVWLICKKRPTTTRPGWDNRVLEEMRERITERLRDFWDAGIRGPDFVWAATGPALEAYSKHPVVKKADEPGQVMAVGEFLSHARRMVVDFVVGRVLSGAEDGSGLPAADRMDSPTAYYLLHRHYFGHGEAPTGASILYATACGLSDRDLETTWDLLIRSGSKNREYEEDDLEDEEADVTEEADAEVDSGGKVRLKAWDQRTRKGLGHEAPGGQPVPLIDRIHRLLHLWKGGDAHELDEYIDEHGLRRHELFSRVLQSLIELSRHDGESDTRLLESLSNHVHARGVRSVRGPLLPFGE